MMELSVIIPAYNAAHTLTAAVESCIIQDFDDFEILIVDNNSTDATMEVAMSLQRKYGNVKVCSEKKQGAAAARNHGVQLAQGAWLQFLDADDVLLPGKWKRQLALVEDSHGWLIGAFIYRKVGGEETVVPVDEDPWRAIMYSGGIGCMHANLFRKEVYLGVRGMEEEMQELEDYKFYFKLLKGSVGYVVDFLPSCVYIRYREPTLSTSDDVRRTGLRVQLSFEIIEYLRCERAQYWRRKRKFMNSALFLHLRRQATFDLDSAFRNYQQYFSSGLNESVLDLSILPPSLPLLKVLGFYRAEKIRNSLRRFKHLLLGKGSGS